MYDNRYKETFFLNQKTLRQRGGIIVKKSNKKRILSLLTAVVMLAALIIQKPVTAQAKNVSDYKQFWSNVNTSGVSNGPTKATTFKVKSGKKLKLNAISIYQYNYGSGKTPGRITLKKGKTTIGTWKAQGRYYNQWWDVFPGITLQAGTYTITCSSKSTWSYNGTSNNAGFAEVYGTYTGAKSSLDKPTIKSITYNKKEDGYVSYKIKWNKISKATGYQIQASSDKKFKKILAKTNTQELWRNFYRGTSTKDNQRIYIRVRAYKKSGSKTTYGPWSKTKSYIHSFKK
jgi:hypothetical protein